MSRSGFSRARPPANRQGSPGRHTSFGYRWEMGLRIRGLESVAPDGRVGDADDRALG